MQNMSQVITFSATIGRSLGVGESQPLIVDQDDNLLFILLQWQELVALINDYVYVEDEWQLETLFDITCSPAREAWGMGHIKFWHKGKYGGRGQEERFDFKVTPNGFLEDKAYGPAPKLSAQDVLTKVIQLAKKCSLGRTKTPEEVEIDLDPEKKRKALAEEAILLLK